MNSSNDFIKIVYENDPYTYSISQDGDDIVVSRKVTIEELAQLLNVDVIDILDNKIGFYVLDKTINYAKFHGKHIADICTHNTEKSSYCRNYYTDDEGNEIFMWSDDDNYSTYECNGIEFAESFTSCGDIIEVYEEFLKEN